MVDDFSVALADVCQAYPALEPPAKMRPSEGAAKVFKIKRPGGGSGFWNPLETPYMVKPLDSLANRRYQAVAFCGPAQTGKTAALIDAWIAHNVCHDPGDMLVVQMTQDKAREFSKQRVDRMLRNSEALKRMLSVRSSDDNTHDKSFRNGMWLRLAWPTSTNLASTSYRFVAGTDYDRWPDDIDGEGDGFSQMLSRIKTFLSRGKVAVESSPGRPVKDHTWQPATPHEAPPVGGILGIYNQGDRQRWQWKCRHCGEWFEAKPGLSLFGLPHDDELLEGIRKLNIDRFARQYARIPCPCCGGVLTQDLREPMNQAGIWLPEGMSIDSHDRLSGNPRVSNIASFWLGGVAATYIPWVELIRRHLQALLEYELTGDEFKLQSTANVDQGVPYLSRALTAAAESTRTRTHDDTLQQWAVPEWTRFVVAAVDVQGGKNARFEVQVHAIGEHMEQALVTRYAIKTSKRPGLGDEFAPIDPGAHPEDWDILNERVLQATYRTPVEGREIRTKLTVVDSGGEEGVTTNAYAWRRRLRAAGLSQLVRLSKGANGRPEWHTKLSMVGGESGKGDVPLVLFDPNKFKDIVDANLKRHVPGPGYYHFPQPFDERQNPTGWLPKTFFDELKAEIRLENGTWMQVKPRNESFDLCVMIRVGCMVLGADKRTFWDNPPPWALPLPQNPDVIDSEVRRAERAAAVPVQPLPAAPAPPTAVDPWERRVHRSAYLG